MFLEAASTCQKNKSSLQEVHSKLILLENKDTQKQGLKAAVSTEHIEDCRKYFNSMIERMYDEKVAPEKSLKLEQSKCGSFTIRCLPCSGKKPKVIEAGCKSRSLSNVKAHIKTPSHKKNVNDFHCRTQEKRAEFGKSTKSSEDVFACQGKERSTQCLN